MRILFIAVALTLLGSNALQAQSTPQMSEKQHDSLSYSLGLLVAQNIKQQGFEGIDAESFAAALDDALQDKPTMVDLNTANQTVQAYMQAKQEAQFAEVKQAGLDFLAENAKRPEVQVTPSGLQYEVLHPGSGAKPTPADQVQVHYHGTLIDGTVFDSSVERGTPATFGVTQVIQGWVEGLQLMSTGAKYKFYIPYNLAYGERAAGAAIKPFSTLVFEVELLDIK